MNGRQLRGIAYLITAAVFALGGGALVATGVTPAWVDVAINVIAAIAAVLGVPIIAKPDTSVKKIG